MSYIKIKVNNDKTKDSPVSNTRHATIFPCSPVGIEKTNRFICNDLQDLQLQVKAWQMF